MRNIVEHGQISGSRETTVLSGVSASSRWTRWISVATGDGGAGRCGGHLLDDEVGGAHLVGEGAHLEAGLGVGDHDPVGVLRPEGLDVARLEPLVHRAVALPEQEGGLLGVALAEAAEVQPRVPHPHVLVAVAHGQARVAAEVLVGEEQHLVALARAHSSTARAFVEVQTAPPLRPTNALRAAEEFM
jgi:hypothetical protein